MKFTHNNTEYELLVLHLSGSKLYGNSTPASDTDYRGVFIAPKETKLGLLDKVEQIEGLDVYKALKAAGLELEETDDITLWELNRFADLCLTSNPNMMDTISFDYTNKETAVYVSEKGKELLDSKDLFMSTKLKFTFSGYAMAQLKRIKGHNKWINEFPDTDKVLKRLKETYILGFTDFDWIVENFGGKVAEKVSGFTQEENNLVGKRDVPQMTWKDFKESADFDADKYRVPRLIDYMKPYTLDHSPLDLDEQYDNLPSTIREILETSASFRKFGESVLSVYTDGKGVFGREGNLKANDSEHLGEFVCLVTVNHNQYKSDKDHVNKMWEWKVKRNEKRGKMEEEFGVDLKHLSHLWRLMNKAKEIMTTGKYTPEFSGQDLQDLKDIRSGGKWGNDSYAKALEFGDTIDDELEELYKNCTVLPKKPNVKKVNELVLKLQKD